ncbi:50S ribosomal protein L9 [Stomatohabitans albus]|uniref:50S ribosomal protein L9 n=1 Tax=Stomatohabitans albus TaxID=3110766 RepID=UPI00300CDB47
MQIILKADVPNLGDAGDVVDVRRGYANNYLLPKGLAILATGGALKDAQLMARSRARREAGNIATAETQKATLEGSPLTTSVKAGVDGTLYGSVGKRNIAELIEKQHGIIVNYKTIGTDRPIKTTGEHEVPVRLHRDVHATITLVIEGEVDANELAAHKAEQERLAAKKAEADQAAKDAEQAEAEQAAEAEAAAEGEPAEGEPAEGEDA